MRYLLSCPTFSAGVHRERRNGSSKKERGEKRSTVVEGEIEEHAARAALNLRVLVPPHCGQD
jgi:hypothetical protein